MGREWREERGPGEGGEVGGWAGLREGTSQGAMVELGREEAKGG